MKKLKFIIISLIFILGLSACDKNVSMSSSSEFESISASHESSADEEISGDGNSSQPELPKTDADAVSQSEVVGNIIQPIRVADGFYDIGKSLFPNDDTRFSGRILDNDRLLVTTLNESAIYNYRTGEILQRLPLTVEWLGMEHFYSQQQKSENLYVITLYDRELNVLAQHESNRLAFPALDGKTILYNQYDQRGRIITFNTETGEEKEFDYKTLNPNAEKPYEGSIWIRAFDGEYVFFSTTNNPVSVNPGIGALSIMTGEGIFSADFPTKHFPGFSGIPDPFGKNKAIFWQDGSAYGTDGTYCAVVDAANNSIEIVDVGTTACRMSDNGEFLVAIGSAWKADTSQIVLEHISTFSGDTFEPLSSMYFDFESPIESDYGSSFNGISISEDGKYVCFSGNTEENGIKRQTLFMYEVKAN